MTSDRTRGAPLVALLAVLAVAACNDAPAAGSAGGHPTPPPRVGDPARERAPGTKPVVVLVTMDGVRWQDVFEGTDAVLSRAPSPPSTSLGGSRPPNPPIASVAPLRSAPSTELMPNLHRLAKERGAAVGAPGRGVMTAVGPNFVSLPGYIEILTGRKALRCQDNDCPRIEEPTFLDHLHESGAKVATFASWDRMDRAASARPNSFMLSYGRHGDKAIDPSPGVGDYRPDRVTADLALRYLESSRPDFLFLGLGDPDELGHNNDYPGYLSAIRQADAILGEVLKVLDRLGDRGANAHVFVTADHGRSKDFIGHGGHAPESARVWLVAAGPRIKVRGFVSSPRERHLTDIVPTIRRILDLPRDDSPHAGVSIDELLVAP